MTIAFLSIHNPLFPSAASAEFLSELRDLRFSDRRPQHFSTPNYTCRA